MDIETELSCRVKRLSPVPVTLILGLTQLSTQGPRAFTKP